jgi:hypothetical protein
MKDLIFLLLLLPALFNSCRTIKPERPDEYYSDVALKPAVSTINVPIEFDVKELEKIFNKEYQGLIYSDTSFSDNKNDGLKLKAYKSDNITFTVDGNQLSYRVPLYVVIQKRFELGAFGFAVSDVKEASASVVLKFRTKLTLNSDWSVTSYTASDGYEWITAPALKLGPVSLPLPVISDMLLESNLGTIGKEIDRSIKQAFNLATLADETWRGIQQPLKISENLPLWVRISPLEVSAVPLQGSGNLARQMLGIRVTADLYYGGMPDYNLVTTVPGLKFTSRLDEGFSISLLTTIPFGEINEIACRELKGYTITQGKYTLRLEDVSLFGNGERLVVAANVSGSVTGTIFLTAIPWFDKATSSIKLRDIDFDIRTKNALVKSASWILRGGIAGKVAEKLVFPAGDLLETAQKELRSYLAQEHSYRYFTVTGTLDRADLENIAITRSSVKVLFTFRGTLNVGLSGD